MSASTPILTSRKLARSFRMGDSSVDVLSDVSVRVEAGEFLAIEGRSGSGKSTLLHIMGALDQPTSGEVLFEDRNIVKLGPRARAELRRRQFGFVFQFYHLLPELDVMQNTLLPAMTDLSVLAYLRQRSGLRRRAADLLDRLGLSHRLRHRPSQLSGGERQRVAIGRALINQPRVLFADEPTGNLDSTTGRQIMELLEDLHRRDRQTIIMVTHDRSIAARADRVLVLRNGRLTSPETREP